MTTPGPDLIALLDLALDRGRPELARLAGQLDALVALRSATFAAMERTGHPLRNADDLLRYARTEEERATLTALISRMTTTTKGITT